MQAPGRTCGDGMEISGTLARAGPEVDPLTLRPKQHQHLGGVRPGAAKPERGAGVEFGGLTGRSTRSCSPSRNRSRPDSTYIHS